MSSNREFELKLALSQDDLGRLMSHPMLSNPHLERSEKVLKSTYYDTPDLRLRDMGVALRVRDDGNGFVQTVKVERRFDGGVSDTAEIEGPVESKEPDLKSIGDKSLRRKLAKAVTGSSLKPAFKTIIKRTSYKLEQDGGTAELALDRGEARTKGRKAPICEAELEFLKGDTNVLLGLAQQLFAGQAVQLSPMTKAERGYRLLLEMQEPRQDLSPEKAKPSGVTCGQTCAESFAAIFQAAREQIIANRTVVLETDQAEGAHQLRVGLTRLRAAHRALKPLIDTPAFHQLEGDARSVARAAGELRDADVLIEDIYAPVAGAASDQQGFDALLCALHAHRSAKQESARSCLQGEQWSRLLLGLALWPAILERTPSLQQQTIEDYAKKALQKRWKKVAKMGQAIDRLAPEEKHKMRRSLKKLRYMTEFFAPVFPAKEVQPFVKQLKALQDVFGYVNDVRMAEQLRAIVAERGDGPDCALAAGVVLGVHEEKAVEAWTHAKDEWRRLKSRGRFWA